MAANIEIEAKALITKKEYEKIVKIYQGIETDEFDQTTYYIDTEKREIKAMGMGLRIRSIKGLLELTLKAPMAEGLLEKNQSILIQDYKELAFKNKFPSGNISNFITMLGVDVKDLKIIASLTTHRIEYKEGNSMLSIDRNLYNGIVDYELELEGPSLEIVKTKLEEICVKNNIVYKDNKQSKQARAMSTINN
jgi:uncharacterized protein YjbK